MHRFHPIRNVGILLATVACLSFVAIPIASAGTNIPGWGNPTPSLCHGKTYTIGIDIYSQGESFATGVVASVINEAGVMGCVTVDTLVDNASAATALSNIQTFINEKVNGVILENVVQSADPGLLSALAAANIPVVTSFISPEPQSSASPFIDVNDGAAGKSGGEALASNFLKLHPGKIPYVIVGGFPEGGPISVARMSGFESGVKAIIKKLPSSHVMTVDTQASPSVAYTVTGDALSSIPKGSYILFSGINDETTNGMYEAINAAGRIKFASAMGMGGDPSGVYYICHEKSYFGSVGFFPEDYGLYQLPAVIDMANGVTVPEHDYLPSVVLTAKNVKTYYHTASC
jgi:ABC-type sugar transport system substrate-binding protein